MFRPVRCAGMEAAAVLVQVAVAGNCDSRFAHPFLGNCDSYFAHRFSISFLCITCFQNFANTVLHVAIAYENSPKTQSLSTYSPPTKGEKPNQQQRPR
jgi:hypothetical protein